MCGPNSLQLKQNPKASTATIRANVVEVFEVFLPQLSNNQWQTSRKVRPIVELDELSFQSLWLVNPLLLVYIYWLKLKIHRALTNKKRLFSIKKGFIVLLLENKYVMHSVKLSLTPSCCKIRFSSSSWSSPEKWKNIFFCSFVN